MSELATFMFGGFVGIAVFLAGYLFHKELGGKP